MVTVKTDAEIALMRKANRIVSDVLNLIRDRVKPGVTTGELDRVAHDYMAKCHATPSFLGYNGYPASICASVNEQVVHGIPGKRMLEEGDLLSVDVGAIYQGWHGDAARSFAVGEISRDKQRLIEVTQQSFFEAMKVVREDARIGDIGFAVQSYAEEHGYSVVRALTGHGIGCAMHEDPNVPNYGRRGHGLRLKRNMTLAIEPMINIGTYDVEILDDGWTVVTKDMLPSAHYENTVLITQDGAEILSL